MLAIACQRPHRGAIHASTTTLRSAAERLRTLAMSHSSHHDPKEQAMARLGSNAVVVIALIGNLAHHVSKFVAASHERQRGDGERRRAFARRLRRMSSCCSTACAARMRRQTGDHPFGHGREAYFWSFIVALLILIARRGVSFYQGFSRLQHAAARCTHHAPRSISCSAISFVFEGISWWAALSAHPPHERRSSSYYEAFRASKDPACSRFCSKTAPRCSG